MSLETDTVKARDLTPGDELVIGADRYFVEKAKVKKSGVRLVITGKPGTFDRVVDAGRAFERVVTASSTEKAPVISTVDLDAPPTKAEKRVRRILKAVPLAVEVGGIYHVPDVEHVTVAAHLLTFHGVRWDGVSLAEAKKLLPDAERTMSADAALVEASWRKALEVHADHHARMDAGEVVDGVTAHVHMKKEKK